MLNRKFFYDSARQRLFDGNLKASQVDGLDGILNEWEQNHAKKDDRWLAYMLGTVHHETDRTFRPIKEYGGDKYFTRMYDPLGERPALAKSMGNTTPGDGKTYYGRGFVQLTWKVNYQAMSPVTGVNLVANPERALELPIATKILFYGMMNGTFTTKKLSDYFNPQLEDWVNALFLSCRFVGHRPDPANFNEYVMTFFKALSPDRIAYVEVANDPAPEG